MLTNAFLSTLRRWDTVLDQLDPTQGSAPAGWTPQLPSIRLGCPLPFFSCEKLSLGMPTLEPFSIEDGCSEANFRSSEASLLTSRDSLSSGSGVISPFL